MIGWRRTDRAVKWNVEKPTRQAGTPTSSTFHLTALPPIRATPQTTFARPGTAHIPNIHPLTGDRHTAEATTASSCSPGGSLGPNIASSPPPSSSPRPSSTTSRSLSTPSTTGCPKPDPRPPTATCAPSPAGPTASAPRSTHRHGQAHPRLLLPRPPWTQSLTPSYTRTIQPTQDDVSRARLGLQAHAIHRVLRRDGEAFRSDPLRAAARGSCTNARGARARQH